MLLYAFQDSSFQWHGDVGATVLDGRPGSGSFVHREAFPGASPAFAGQRLLGLYGPCDLESSAVEIQLEDGVRLFLTWNVAELLQCGPRTANRAALAAAPPDMPPNSAGPRRSGTASPARRHARRTGPWTPEEDRQCHAAIAAGAPLEVLARQLRRSVKAVRFHLPALGLADFPYDLLSTRGQPAKSARAQADPNSYRARVVAQHARAYQPWSTEEDATLLRLNAEGLTIDQIATTLERQPSVIQDRLGRHDPSTRPAYQALPAWDDGEDEPIAG